MTETLEGNAPPAEGSNTQNGVDESTIRKFSQKEFDEALGKSVSTLQTRLSANKTVIEKAQADLESSTRKVGGLETTIAEIQAENDELARTQFAHDPEARNAYISNKSAREERRRANEAKMEADVMLKRAQQETWAVTMATQATSLVKEYGIDIAQLEDCKTVEEMEVKAIKYHLAESKKGKESEGNTEESQPYGKTQRRFVQPSPPVAGQRIYTRQQIASMSLEEYAKNKDAVWKAYEENRVK